jgi:type I restriction enzyme M protein
MRQTGEMATSSNNMHQVLTRAGQTSDPWGRYYTTPNISRTLIDQIEVTKPKLLLELGSGSGSLWSAAATRWSDAELITVDLDRAAVAGPDAHKKKSSLRHSHFVHDVLDSTLSERIGLNLGSVDVAVCNPPYIRPKWRADFGKILEEAGLSGALASVHDAGADLLFLAQNLRLLRKNGKLGLILPDGLITAERFSCVRRTLLRQHSVEQVVQLPRGVFKGTEAQTYLVVLSKSAGETNRVVLRQMGVDGQLSAPIEIEQDAAVKRLDFNFNARAVAPRIRGQRVSLSFGQVLTEVVRGTVCSSGISTFPAPVFHLGDFSKPAGEGAVRIVPRRFALGKRAALQISQVARLALPGDILLARVGRSLEDQLGLVVHGPCVISDCIFALRATEEHREHLYRFLESDSGKSALASSAHGVAAKFLSKANLLEIQF